MPPRSKILLLPAEIRQELDRRLIEGAFSGFVELSDWLSSKGYEVGKSAIHAYGQSFQDKVDKIKLATEQAKAIVEGSSDDGAAMNEALMRLVQERLFSILVEANIDPKTINISSITKSVAELGRTVIKQKEFRQKYDAELASRTRAAGDKVAAIARENGLSSKAVAQLRREVLGIRPKAAKDGVADA